MGRGFIGRSGEIGLLQKRLTRAMDQGDGTAITLRGRRQVGKSRLVQEFCDRSNVPYFYFTAIKGAGVSESVRRFCAELREADITENPDSVPLLESGNWHEALQLLASAISDRPAIVVLDEVPWLTEADSTFDASLQVVWDRQLASQPVLLCLLGSDLHMMERLTAYDRPFYGRADNLSLGPFHPAETAAATKLPAADALEAHLVSGGMPGIIRHWPHETTTEQFLWEESVDPASPLFSIPESSLLSEFPLPDTSRAVLEAIGAGNRTVANIASDAGGRESLASGTLTPLLRKLVTQKRVITRRPPLSTRPGKPTLFAIADSNLSFFLHVGRSAQELARRGHGQQAFSLMQRRLSAWYGNAIEPLVRQSVELAAHAGLLPWPEVRHVGGWWNRKFDPEIDLVGADRTPVANRVPFVGSIKWLGSAFDRHDVAQLRRGAQAVPGFSVPEGGLMAISRSGFDVDSSDLLCWGPDEVIEVWQ